ncbi:MAG: ExeA family protein, partial [Planctomycetaceae bacterium]
MYESWWKLSATPFQNAADAQWYFESAAHEEASARLMFVIERQRRCGVVWGSAGCGKSTMLAMLARQLQRTQRELALIDATSLTGTDLLWQTAVALDRNPSPDERPRELWQAIADHLHGLRFAGIQTIMLIDHLERAGRGFDESLVRLIELEAAAIPWLTVIVAVRPSAGRRLPGRLAEFCDLRLELRPLDRPETAEYVRTALRRAGCRRDLFTADALARLHER